VCVCVCVCVYVCVLRIGRITFPFLIFGNIPVTFLIVYESDVHAPKMRRVSLYFQATSEISDVSLLIFFLRKGELPA